MQQTNATIKQSMQLKLNGTEYDKKSDEGGNSVRMRPENSGALKVVKNWLSTRVSDSSDAQLSDYV